MAKVVAPLLSFDARGKIADTQVYSNWRGVPYVRRYVVPGNPKTTAQILTRDIFAAQELRWKQGGPLMRSPWDRFAVGQKFVGRNAYLGKNIAVLRGDADLEDYIGSPGAKGGLPLTTLTAVGAAGNVIDVTLTAPAVPTGWTIEAVVATAIVDQTPEATVADIVAEGEDAAAPFDTVQLSGLLLVPYWVQGWIRWTKPDSSVAYGPSITIAALVTPLA